jgi:hypothetical protein
MTARNKMIGPAARNQVNRLISITRGDYTLTRGRQQKIFNGRRFLRVKNNLYGKIVSWQVSVFLPINIFPEERNVRKEMGVSL